MKKRYTEITPGTFMIQGGGPRLSRNAFLRILKGNGHKINMLIDPGARDDFDGLVDALDDLIGGVKNVDVMFLSHQDPDLTGNAVSVQTYSNANLITTYDTWRLIRSCGYDEKRYIPLDRFFYRNLNFKTGHTFQAVSLRFCHSPGSAGLFDYETATLFSGDLFANLNMGAEKNVWSDHNDWEGMEIFHTIYMPSSYALKGAMESIEGLIPKVEYILPQHGKLLNVEQIPYFIDKLRNTNVGMSASLEIIKNKSQWIRLINRMMVALSTLVDEKRFNDIISKITLAEEFTPTLIFEDKKVINTKIRPDKAFTAGYSQITNLLDPIEASTLRDTTRSEMLELKLPIPAILDADPSYLSGEGPSFSELFGG